MIEKLKVLLPLAAIGLTGWLWAGVAMAQRDAPVQVARQVDVEIVQGVILPVLTVEPVAVSRPVSRPALRAAPHPGSTPRRAASGPRPPEPVELSFTVRLRDGTRMIGVLHDTDSLPVEVLFGVIEIPLAQIRAIVLSEKTQQAKILFKNGDVLTGRPRLARFRLTTSYGRIEVPLDEVVRLAAGDQFSPEPSATRVAAAPSQPGRPVAAPWMRKQQAIQVWGAAQGVPVQVWNIAPNGRPAPAFAPAFRGR